MTDFVGTTDPDVWIGTGEADTAHGGDGDDILRGAGGNDSIYGEGGNDILYGGPGVDLIDGGAGDDRLVIFFDAYGEPDLAPGDQFVGGSGTDELYVTTNSWSGTPYDLTGLVFPADVERLRIDMVSVLVTLAQVDHFSQLRGVFRLTNSGTINLTANRLTDGQLFLADGDDVATVAGNLPINSLSLDGGGGNDHLIGSEWHDLLVGGAGNDRLEGRDGIDTLDGGDGDDILLGGDGDDNLFDSAGADSLDGGAGNDTFHLNVDLGFSVAGLVGGTGVDTIWLLGVAVNQTIDLSVTPIPDDIEGLSASWARLVGTAEQINRFERLEVRWIEATTGGNFTLAGNLSFGGLTLSNYASNVDLSGATGFSGYTVDGGAAADTIVGSNGVDYLSGAGGNDVIHGGGSFDQLKGGTGVDWLDGGGGDDYFLVEQDEIEAGDRFTGGAGVDWLLLQGVGTASPSFDLRTVTIDLDIERIEARRPVTVALAQLTPFTQIYTNAGLQLADGGSVDFTGKQTSGTLLLSNAGNQVTLSADGFDVIGGTADDSIIGTAMLDRAILVGGGGNDVITSGAGDDQLDGNAGNDRLEGGAGNDMLDGGNGADEMVGGLGSDQYRVDSLGDVVTEQADGGQDQVMAVSSFVLAAGAEIEFLLVENVHSTNAVDLTGNDFDNRIGGNAGANFLDGRGGNDRLEGDAGDDMLYSGSGWDMLNGGEGRDGLYFGSWFDGVDSADGGYGIDTFAIQGNYAGLILANIANVEVLLAASGADTRFGDTAGNFYDYGLVAPDALVASGGTLTVIAGELRAGEDLAFNGAAETDGNYRIFAGRGSDTLSGGSRNDGFFFGAEGNLTGADRINGGAGTDSIALRGNYSGATAIIFQDASFSNIEVLTLLSGHTNEFGGFINLDGFDYDVVLANGTIAAGLRLDVIAGNLRSNESARVDARAELDGTVRIISGAGDDTLFGGAGNDILSGGLGADALDGGSGNDSYVYRLATESTSAARDSIAFSGGDRIDLAMIDANAGTPANDGFTFVGAAAFTNLAGQLRAFQSGAQWMVEGDVNGDGVADLVIAVTSAAPLTAADFIL